MKKRQMAIGIETTGAPFTSSVIPSSVCAMPGAIRPRAMPPTMQSATQSVSRRSKPWIRRSLAAGGLAPSEPAAVVTGRLFGGRRESLATQPEIEARQSLSVCCEFVELGEAACDAA